MVKKNKKVPYSFSFSQKMVDNLRYYNNTHPDDKLSQKVEEFLSIIIPDLKG